MSDAMRRAEPVGTLADLTAESIMSALSIPRAGRIFSLESRWWRGMPVHPVHPSFDVLTYRSPRGEQNQKDQEYLNAPANTVNYGFISELMMGTTHTGTHIDAHCHVTCGPRSEWYGGFSADEHLGDFGALNSDASTIPPIVTRGVMLDIPKVLGEAHCPASYPIGAADLEKACELQNVEVRAGDAVLVRTGQMKYWPDPEAMAVAANAGVSMDGSHWLAERRPAVVGSDTVAFEVAPSGVEGSPQPVHVHLIQENGILIMEWINCEELSHTGVSEFLFVCLPLTVIGATGSYVRPVAIV
jgi:kynurenine formamidase